MLNCVQGGYQVTGTDHDFPTLDELVEYYQLVPLSDEGDTLGLPLKHNGGSLGLDIDNEIVEDIDVFVSRRKSQRVQRSQQRTHNAQPVVSLC